MFGIDWYGYFYSILFIDYYWRWIVFYYLVILKDVIVFLIFLSFVFSCLSCKLKKKIIVVNSENIEKLKFVVIYILCYNFRLDIYNCFFL